ncbi:TBC1 domain family member 25 [Trichonephila inaurata madagascariensis]|uniref:TBC1 domain family member 25 n=1 Tax=Trichonephila inaurata madagascariensis TaxID=2747483 RepID=A0A8X7BT18_9ARAC|nr:TBC1 domain family member 25 [Trichonephila inaurata madagascariensis]
MSEILDLHLKHFIKVKVKLLKHDPGNRRSTYEFFTLDPQSANYTKLRSQLALIFNIEGEFVISFKKDKQYIPLTSDFDLDGAISEASKPHLSLTVELKAIDIKTLEEWDIISAADIVNMEPTTLRSTQERRSLAGSIVSHVESAMQKVQRAFSLSFHNVSNPNCVVDEALYFSLLDREGRVFNHRELHMAVYNGGVEPSMRPQVWKHLLNVYPHGMTMEDRKSYMNSKCEEYYQLRYRWQGLVRAGTIPEVLSNIMTMVRKDVRRTDRTVKFYDGPDDNSNIRALFNILTTYAVNHQNVSYCQGMSDLLSPIFYVMKKESEAYVCFCGLMQRMQANFKQESRIMKTGFRHLQKMLRFYEPDVYNYLESRLLLHLLFCYRWLLLDLKREFPYNDMLNMMEILWGSLPPKPPRDELKLYEMMFPTANIIESLKDQTTEKDYLKLNEDYFASSHNVSSLSQSCDTHLEEIKKWQLRVRRESMARDMSFQDSSSEGEISLPIHYRKRKFRQYISGKLCRINRYSPPSPITTRSCKIPERKKPSVPEICQSWSCGEVFEEKSRLRDALHDARDFLRNQWCYSNTVNEIQLNNWLNGRQFEIKPCAIGGKETDAETEESNRQRHGSSDSNYSTISEDLSDVEDESRSPSRSRRSQSEGYMSDDDSKEASTLADDDTFESDNVYEPYSDDDGLQDSMAGRQYEEVETYFERKKEMLPPPHELGDGNPFLLFLCIAMFRCQRDNILNERLEGGEVSIHFDRMVRKHDLSTVLPIAQELFTEYLSMGWNVEDQAEMSDDPDT